MRKDEQKRAKVLERLQRADAGALSDRAIARELGVSQPFVSRLRRQALAQRDPMPVSAPLVVSRETDAGSPAGGRAAAREWQVSLPRPDPSRDVLGSDIADASPPVGGTRPACTPIEQLHRDRYGVPVGDIRVSTPVDADIANERAATEYDPLRRTLEPRRE